MIALEAYLAKWSAIAPAEVPSAAPSCSRPGSAPEQSARTSAAADEEVKSPEKCAPEPDTAEAAARLPLVLMTSGLRAACESAAMRWLQGQLTWCGRESLHRTKLDSGCRMPVRDASAAAKSCGV